LWLACADLLTCRGSGLRLIKSVFDSENFYAGSPGLSPAILAQFTFKMCVAARNRKKLRTLLILCFKVVQNHRGRYPHPHPSKKLVTSACYNKQHIYTYLQLFIR